MPSHAWLDVDQSTSIPWQLSGVGIKSQIRTHYQSFTDFIPPNLTIFSV